MILSNITDLIPNPDKKGFVDVYADGELILTLSDDAVVQAGIRIGDRIDSERLLEIEYAITLTKAKAKAYDYLSYGDMSKAALCKKLVRYGFKAEVADAAAQELENAGYIDDERYGAALAEYLAGTRLYGPRRIKQELLLKGVSAEIADAAIDGLATDFGDSIRTLASGKFKKDLSDRKQVSKLIAALMRYGFEYEMISGALSHLEDDYE